MIAPSAHLIPRGLYREKQLTPLESSSGMVMSVPGMQAVATSCKKSHLDKHLEKSLTRMVLGNCL